MSWSIFRQGGGDNAAVSWAQQLLALIGAPQSAGNVAFVYDWEKAEGAGGAYNPLNQGPVPGHPELTTTGSQYGGGAADYASWQAGLTGASDYLHMNNYKSVLNALVAGNSAAARSALFASPWAASHYGYGKDWPNVAPTSPGGQQLGTGQPTATDPGTANAVVPVGFHLPGTPWDIPTPGDAIKGVEGAAAGISRTLTRVGIMLPLVAGGSALLVLGFMRMTGTQPKGLPI